jgi:hypothetical protein
LSEIFKTRKNSKSSNFSLENFKRRIKTFKFTIFGIKFSNLGKIILGILTGILKLNKIFVIFFGGNILILEKI